MEDETINKVKHVLNDWNPLGENASRIEDDCNEILVLTA